MAFIFPDYITNRAIGRKKYLGIEDNICLKLYKNYSVYKEETSKITENQASFLRNVGGIFNFDFNPDGRILAVACEKQRILLYDSITQKLTHTIRKAHSNCVNCIRFLDEINFASGSDDARIKLWDVRNLKQATRTLYGHSGWIKNVEYSEKEQLIVSSSFDGAILAWNLKSNSENGRMYENVFNVSGLMRTKLSPDDSQMLISTTSGYILLIHDLNLSTLSSDLKYFKPHLYHLMQVNGQNYPAGTALNHLFYPNRKRNRVEIIDDFPNKARMISSLQIHPHGWCAVSRNIGGEVEEDEWASVHDIQRRHPAEYDEKHGYIEEDFDQIEDDIPPDRPTDLWLGMISYNEDQQLRRNNRDFTSMREFAVTAMTRFESGLLNRNRPPYRDDLQANRRRTLTNLKRLTHFIKELNMGVSYIKEPCFSPDGRIICSPYNKGFRFLTFNEKAQELSNCVPKGPQELVNLMEFNDCHPGVVLATKFNPFFSQLVCGCLSGQITWYQPRF